MNNEIKLVIFDLAGTLVDYGCFAPVDAYIELFRRHGVEIGSYFVRKFMGLNKKEHLQCLAALPEVQTSWLKNYGVKISEFDLNTLYHEFLKILTDQMPLYSHLIDGAQEAIENIKSQQVKIAVTSGYPRFVVNIIAAELKKQGIIPDAIVSSSDVNLGRPAPEMIFECMKITNTQDFNQVINFGDTVHDVKSAVNAGVWSVGVLESGNLLGMAKDHKQLMSKSEWEFRREKARLKLVENGAHFVISAITDAWKIFQQINRISSNNYSQAVW
jgi:phosphonoacetaldehyde hydrolase